MKSILNCFDACVQKIDAKNRNIALLAAVFSVLFLPFASVYTSPLNPYYGTDAAAFMIFGKGITEGFVPYLDLYDHKGPLLFFLNAFGYLFYDGKLGVFCLQIVFFTLVLFCLYKMSRLFLEAKYVWFIELAFCYYYFTMVEGGNLSEEWSLLFSVVPMYLALRFLSNQDAVAAHPLWYSFVYGICLGAQSLIRLNNASILCGIILAFVILLLREKAYRALFANAGVVLLGVVVIALPFVCYFWANDVFSAFIQAAYIDNFIYAFEGSQTKNLLNIVTVLVRVLLYPVAVCAGGRLYKAGQLKASVLILVICMGGVSAPLLFLGYGYLHYFLTFAPVMALALVLVCKLFLAKLAAKRCNILGFICALCIAFLPFGYLFARQVAVNFMMTFFAYNQAEITSVEQVMEHVPQEEYDSVLAYDVSPRFYLYADVMPCYRFFAWQSFQSIAAPQNAVEIATMLTSDAPLWIVTEKEAVNLTNETLKSVLESEYTLIDVADYGLGLYLYQKNEVD